MIHDVPRIVSARLEIVPLRVADAPLVYDDAKDPALYRYLQQRPPGSLADLEALFARWSGGSTGSRSQWLNWIPIERSTNERIGLLQATIDIPARVATIGYSIFARFQGRRFAREAAGAMLARLKARGDIDRAVAEISEPNMHSRAVIESLGFAPTGRIAGTGREDGRICDDVVYTLVL
ncbi:MAG: GNAT family N-acetyltransferase [Candidatus Velthaea sp.]